MRISNEFSNLIALSVGNGRMLSSSTAAEHSRQSSYASSEVLFPVLVDRQLNPASTVRLHIIDLKMYGVSISGHPYAALFILAGEISSLIL